MVWGGGGWRGENFKKTREKIKKKKKKNKKKQHGS